MPITNGYLIISGGGHMDEIPRLQGKIFECFNQIAKPKLLIVPFANQRDDYDDIREYFEEVYGRVFSRIDMLEAVKDIPRTNLESYDLVCLEGGNTFDLLRTIQTTSLMSDLPKYWRAGGSLHGDSAGAIVLGANADTAYFGDEMDDNQSGLQKFGGLDLFDAVSIHCHYKPSEDEECQDFMYNTGTKLIAIPEFSGVVVSRDGSAAVSGQEPVALFSFTEKRVVRPGEQFHVRDLHS